MARPNYANKGGRSDRGGYHGSYGEPQKSSEMNAVMSEINKVSDLAEISIETIAGPDGIAEKSAKLMKTDLNSSQLRKFFDTIIKIKEKQGEGGWEKGESDFFMLYPTLAYAKGRKTIPDDFYNLTTGCLKKIPSAKGPEQSVENYNRFVNLMESLVAYSKYYSKKG